MRKEETTLPSRLRDGCRSQYRFLRRCRCLSGFQERSSSQLSRATAETCEELSATFPLVVRRAASYVFRQTSSIIFATNPVLAAKITDRIYITLASHGEHPPAIIIHSDSVRSCFGIHERERAPPPRAAKHQGVAVALPRTFLLVSSLQRPRHPFSGMRCSGPCGLSLLTTKKSS